MAVMPQIETIVFLMMENRSLDNVLGWLYSDRPPDHFFPTESPHVFDGLIEGRFSNPFRSLFGGVHDYPVTAIPEDVDPSSRDRVPANDPYEALEEAGWHGVMNQLFGDEDRIDKLPASGSPALMKGFLQDYYARYMVGWQGLDILWTYTPADLPVLNELARGYAVSDRWFSSVPTQTNPNRAFSLCGTSLGRDRNQNWSAVEQFDLPTVFNALANANKSWGLYYSDLWVNGKCYTDYTFPRLSRAVNGVIAPIVDFFTAAREGQLPNFTYLEPKWGYGKGGFDVQGTDYHPPTRMAPGDSFLAAVYNALAASPQWERALLVVTFDEHGGTFDHVGPPWGAINPDGRKAINSGFDFDLFGVRVPTLLVSPFIRPATVFRAPADSAYPFDHTSFIKTMLLWAGIDLGSVDFGKRVLQAPSFDAVLADELVGTAPVDLSTSVTEFDANVLIDPDRDSRLGEPAPPLNVLFADVPFASIRAILGDAPTPERIKQGIDQYTIDPERFESDLLLGEGG